MTGALQKNGVFWVLLIEDNPADLYLLERALKDPVRPCRLDSFPDGASALAFLEEQERTFELPDLILLNAKPPRFEGIDALAALKNDPRLAIVPVIVLSSLAMPTTVRRSYRANASCFVQKPTSVDEFEQFMQALKAFWMRYAVSPSRGSSGGWEAFWNSQYVLENFPGGDGGPSLATPTVEVSSPAMNAQEPVMTYPMPRPSNVPAGPLGCSDHRQLLHEFGAAVQELLRLHEQQFLAIAQGDPESSRFDLLIHMTNEKKQQAKYAYLRHVELHGCSVI